MSFRKYMLAGVLMLMSISFSFGESEFLNALKHGKASEAAAQRFIEQQEDVNQQDKYGWTPLMYAVKNGDVRICEILLSAEANVSIVDKKGFSATDYVSSFLNQLREFETLNSDQNDRLKRLLYIERILHASDAKTDNSLFRAVEKNDLSLVMQIIAKKPSLINQPDKDGMTPLILASTKGNTEIVRYLLDHHADIGMRDGAGLTAYDHAARSKDIPETTKRQIHLLLENKLKKKDVDDIKKLIKQGHNINRQSRKGRTMLMLAAAKGNIEACHLLLENGVDISIKDLAGNTVHDFVCRDGGSDEDKDKILDLIKKYEKKQGERGEGAAP